MNKNVIYCKPTFPLEKTLITMAAPHRRPPRFYAFSALCCELSKTKTALQRVFCSLGGRRLAWFGCQKVGKSHPKSVLWRSPALWGDLRRPLGRLWVPFGGPGVPKSRLWAIWAAWGSLLASFGLLWEASKHFFEARGLIWGPRRRKRRLFGIMRFT